MLLHDIQHAPSCILNIKYIMIGFQHGQKITGRWKLVALHLDRTLGEIVQWS